MPPSGGTLTARELLAWGSGFHVGLSFYYPLRCRAESVAVFPLVLLARRVAQSEMLRPCHWRLAMPGFPGEVLIPLGRLQTFPILLLARGPLWFHHPHLRAGHIHARRIVNRSRLSPSHDSPVAMHNAEKPTPPASILAMSGSGGGLFQSRVLKPQEEFMGSPRERIVPPSAAPSRPVNFWLGDLASTSVCLFTILYGAARQWPFFLWCFLPAG